MSTISHLRNVTLFAPSNEALEEPGVRQMLQDKKRIRDILKLHYVKERLTLDTIKNKSVSQVSLIFSLAFIYTMIKLWYKSRFIMFEVTFGFQVKYCHWNIDFACHCMSLLFTGSKYKIDYYNDNLWDSSDIAVSSKNFNFDKWLICFLHLKGIFLLCVTYSLSCFCWVFLLKMGHRRNHLRGLLYWLTQRFFLFFPKIPLSGKSNVGVITDSYCFQCFFP